MAYKVQIFHPESGFFLNTNHESDDLEELKELFTSGTFDGVRCRIVDSTGDEVRWDPAPRGRQSPLTIDDMGRIFKVPVVRRIEDLHLPGVVDPDDMSS